MDTLDNMRIFVRVVDAGSFTAAARHLNSTTAQISRAIADLEGHLRTRLLNRTTRRLAVTEAGQRYLQRCEHILAYVDEAEAEAADANVRASGTLRIHAMTSFGQRYLIPALARYREAHPEVSVELTLSQRIPDLLDEGYDTAVVLTRSLPDSGMVSQQLGDIYSVLCASPAYLAAHGTPRRPQDLANHPCVVLQSPFFPADHWWFESLGDDVDDSDVPDSTGLSNPDAAGRRPSMAVRGTRVLRGTLGKPRAGLASAADAAGAASMSGATGPAGTASAAGSARGAGGPSMLAPEEVMPRAESVYVGDSRFRVNVAEALDGAIRAGMGIGLLPSYAAVEGLKEGALVRLFDDYRLQRFEVHALYPSRQYIDAKVRTWIDFLTQSLPKAMAEDDELLASLIRNKR